MLAFRMIATLLVVSTIGCGDKPRDGEVPVYPLQGTVTVDGTAIPMIRVALHRTDASKSMNYPQGFTGEDGSIRVSTYAEGDGAPAGKYRVTFVLQEYDLLSRSFRGPDRLNGRYSDPETTPIEIEIGPDLDNSLGNLDLQTK